MPWNKNVVWITLDSVRLDHTTMGAYRRDTTPHLDALGRGQHGQSTTSCIAHSNWTLASSASILTGTYPSHHGVGMGSELLDEGVKTVAERLSEQGYATGCISRNSHLSSATGLDRGFDHFSWLSASTLLREAGVIGATKYLANIRRHSAGFTTDTAKHSTPFLVNDAAKGLLGDFANEEPFFLYLHYNEPHRPYYPPLPYLDEYTDGIEFSTSEAASFAMDVHYNLHEYVAEGLPFSEAEWEALYAMYDAEIAYTDECVRSLFEYVDAMDLDETVFVVTADHGELFGEGEMLAHKYLLHDALVNVPLVVNGLEEASITESDVVQHGDLMRTFVELACGDADGMQGIDLRSDERETAYSQRGEANFDAFLEHDPDFDTSRFHEHELTSARTSDFKFLHSENRSDLFDLPDESTDVSGRYPEVASRLEERVIEWLERTEGRDRTRREAEFSDAMERQLRDLGYVE